MQKTELSRDDYYKLKSNKKKGKGKVQPIRSLQEIEDIKYFLNMQKNKYKKNTRLNLIWNRNYYLFYFGINVGLRIGDLQLLKVKDINEKLIIIRDEKTNKLNCFNLNDEVYKNMQKYICENNLIGDDYLFKNYQNLNKPVSIQALNQNLFKKIQKEVLKNRYLISTHSLRKTFAYHVYKKTNDMELVRTLLNHGSLTQTQRYIANDDYEKEKLRSKFIL